MLSPASGHDQLDLEAATPFHLLAVGDDVEPEEIDILAAQIWPHSTRLGEGLLELTTDAFLTGPWDLTPEAIVGLGLPLNLKFAYLISVPALRGNPVPQWLWNRDPLWDAFREGGPEGLELEVLTAVRRIARRLAGALRFSTGPVIVPDPDSAVGMRVLSEVWLDPAACLKVVQEVLPIAKLVSGNEPDMKRLSGRERTLATPEERANYDPDGLRARAQAGVSADERAWLHAEAEAFDEAAMSMPAIMDSYAIGADVTQMSSVHIVVQGETAVPPALGHREDGYVSYELKWIAPDIALTEMNKPRRAYRLDRLTVIDAIEGVAKALAEATDGVIVDADEFVVSL
ncbi:MAG: hypothetical protein SPK50_02085 [Mobiluncus porci]|uniref:hypothetical protein n=1 Tax=Mobiluncus porci TaxID=2652278 RepID=UPI0023F0619C|nr:hypothetical protein [Mobiluncus porci]MDD7542557.1 hypothetical protein [Mobiluncus porci]MDY5747909.1 hypothetical protein [Mobiluncus porci]